MDKKNWDNALIVFDTSSLCNMYQLTDESKQTMTEILDTLKSRIWIPGHVMVEYKKNRYKSIKSPIEDFYQTPLFYSKSLLHDKGKDFLDALAAHGNFHPYISPESYKKCRIYYAMARNFLRNFEKTIDHEFEKRKREILEIGKDDIIYNKIKELTIGKELTVKQQIEISKEGDQRYANHIPPGYEDLYKEKKEDLDKYGDLFIWKQILKQAEDLKKDVIFVCDDEKKDWWKNYEKFKLQELLVTEFKEETGQEIMAMSLRGFIDYLEENYKTPDTLPLYQGLEGVKEALNYYYHILPKLKIYEEQYLRIECDRCRHWNHFALKDLNPVWEECGWYEGEMGPEIQYCTSHSLIETCEECEEKFEINFLITEYPAGDLEDTHVTVEGGKLLNHPRYRSYLDLPFSSNWDTCINCGRRVHSLKEEMCHQCWEEFEYKVKHD